MAIFIGLIRASVKKNDWSEGVEVLNFAPQQAPPSTIKIGEKVIRVPSISSFRFVSAMAAPSADSVKVKEFTKKFDGNTTQLPATWMVKGNVLAGEGIEAKYLLGDHSTHAPHLATCNFQPRFSTQEIELVLTEYKKHYNTLRFLHRSNSIRMYSPTPFTQEMAETLRMVSDRVSISFDGGIAPPIAATITSTPDIPLETTFVKELSEQLGFKVPKAFTTASVFVLFKTAVHLKTAAEVLGVLGMTVDRVVRDTAADEETDKG